MRLQHWPDGQKIRVFVLPYHSQLHTHFSRDVLGFFPYQLKRIWNKNTFTGIGSTPVEVADESAMLAAVATTPGAIGYLSFTPEQGGSDVSVVY